MLFIFRQLYYAKLTLVMKKTTTVICICLFILLSGCTREIINITKSSTLESLPIELQELYGEMPTRNYGNITVIGDGILRFTSESHLDSVYAWLRADCELWDDLFVDQYSGLDEEEFEIFENEIGYYEFQPLIEFENQFNILGLMLRDEQESIMQNWYEGGMLGDNPSDPIFLDEVEQTLYSANHEICIGDTIAQYRSDGTIVLIPVSKIEDINQIRNQTVQEIIEEGILVVKTINREEPSYSDHIVIPIKNLPFEIFINDFQKYDLLFNSTPRNCFFSSNVKIKSTTKLTNLEYKNGHWKKVRRNCSVASALSFHAVILESNSSNPPISLVHHYTGNNALFGNNLPVEKFRKSRTDTYTHLNQYPNDYIELGLGTNSFTLSSINSVERTTFLFNQ